MRRIEPAPLTTRAWKRWCTDCDRAATELGAALERGEPLAIAERVYRRSSIRKAFFFSGGPPFYGKCVYCEMPVNLLAGDLDHFRPKQGITSAEDEPIFDLDDEGQPRLDAAGLPRRHPGYYWLAYDWRNLLPCCKECNQPNKIGSRKIGKHNRFPVEGRHARNPAEVVAEKPLLINPASHDPADDPDLHFRVDTQRGLVAGRTPRGKACEEIFGLNHRGTLVEERRKAIHQVRYLLIRMRFQEASAVELLREIAAGKRPFTLVQRAVLREAGALP